jgi:hypothetical protein
MTELMALWLPIVLSTVFVFIASTLLHTVIPWHKGDFVPVPDEAAARRALGPLAIPPGDYLMPYCSSTKEMGSPEYLEKLREGPVVLMTVRPNGVTSMGPTFVYWLVFLLAVSVVAACIAGNALAPGAESARIWRFAGLTAFAAYGFGSWPESIWFGRKWSSAVKATVDAVIYAVITAATFSWLWPAA